MERKNQLKNAFFLLMRKIENCSINCSKNLLSSLL